MRKDNDPEKRRMKGQTEMKHTLLEKYLHPWLLKITEVSREVRYIDGFAGWGRYDNGDPGSPLIAMNVAERLIDGKYGNIGSKLDYFFCDFIEANSDNYSDLNDVVREEKEGKPDQIKPKCHPKEFEQFARDYIEKKGTYSQPAFIFIDPFGFSGLPFQVIKDLLNLRTSGMEAFITFTTGEMARFTENKEHRKAISEILGTERWKMELNPEMGKEEKANKLLKIYEEQLRSEAGVEYVWPFRMNRESKRETVYHLVHATNHFDGFKIMKEIMYNSGAEEQFAYLGPDHYPYLDDQQTLGSFGGEDNEDKRVKSLATYLHERFRNQTDPITLWELMEETYEETTLIEKHYRRAGKLLVKQNKAEINNTSGQEYGFGKFDEIKFIRGTLDEFI